ncbi:MAG TPA: hypothetical protein VKG87_05225, partial [Terriglobales bacterium]|nr:hypothetical protein [Terriglobales bacterium]
HRVHIRVSPHVDTAGGRRRRKGRTEETRHAGGGVRAGRVWSGRASQTSHDAGRQRESADVNALTGRR